jgi:hypothetical protein
MSDPQHEYAEALAAYRDAVTRLQEAKRHIPPSPQDRHRQRLREQRAAERAHYLANREKIDAECNRLTVKALALLHQRVNQAAGESVRIRLPVTYRIVNDDQT